MQNIINTPIVSEMKKAYLDYAMSVIVARALPDVRDGLKPVQRRIIYAANQMGLSADSRYSKSAKLVGEVIGKYHPHGDQSIYDAMVRMAQPFSLRYPLVDGQGNFGSIDGDGPGAMRYTECRLERISDYLLKDIDKDTVEFVDNYSAEYQEPTVLPSIIPNLFINGSTGIAVGMATNIPPHNLGEMIDGLLLVLDKGKSQTTREKSHIIKAYDLIETEAKIAEWEIANELDVKELAQVIKGPDFPTGCTIYDQSETLRYFATGRGRVIQRAKAKIDQNKRGKMQITVTEIPYMVSKAPLIEKIASLVTSKKLKDISDIRDESSGENIRIVVELKREARPRKVLNYLYKYTPLQTAFNANVLALVNGQPQTLSLKEYLDLFIKHRRGIVTRRTLNLLKKAREREHILEGLVKALDHIDQVIETIKKSPDTDKARQNLMKKFKLTEIQAQAILDMQLKKLAALERKKIEDELKEIQQNIERYLEILANPAAMIRIIKKELAEVKEKFADERKTKVIKGGVGELNEEDIVANEETLISVTESGYIKRMKPSTYKSQGRGGKGVMGMKTKETDEVAMIRFAETHDRILFLTSKGRIYEKRVWDIPEASRTSKGTAAANLLDISNSERVQEVITLGKEEASKKDELFILVATKNGNIKKTELRSFENIRRTGITAMGLKDNDEVVRAMLTTGNNIVYLITKLGKSIKFKEGDVRPMGRSACGVRGIKLRQSDEVVGMEVISSEDSPGKILVISAKGYGKMTKVGEYTLQNRGGTGTKASNVTGRTGELVSVKLITSEKEDLIITSMGGQVIRMPLKSMSTLGRDTQGVRVMRLTGDDKVSAAAIIDQDNAIL